MAEKTVIKSQFIPPPIDGIDLISDPSSYTPTQARVLDNYFIYDWGIRERGPITTTAIPDGGDVNCIISFTSAAIRGTFMGTSLGHTYKYTSAGVLTLVDTKAFGPSGPFQFNKYVFLPCAGDNSVSSYALDTDTFAAASFVGMASGPVGGFAFKNRAYFFTGTDCVVSYGDVNQVTGAIKGSFDFASIFQLGRKIVWGSAWSYNQGLQNTELFVVGNEAGEVLIYSGDSPETNWTLMSRIAGPTPLSLSMVNPPLVNVTKLGQDLLLSTTRGVIPLSQIIAGKDRDANYYSVSHNIGAVLKGGLHDRSSIYPFAYFMGSGGVYVLNYERGAWSRFTGTAFSAARCAACSSQATVIPNASNPDSYVIFGLAGSFARLNESDMVTDSSASYVWSTPFINFGDSTVEKRATAARLIGRDIGASPSTVTYNLLMQTELDENTYSGIQDTQAPVRTNSSYVIQEYSPTAVGRWLSYSWQKTGTGSGVNELSGFDALFETGGGY